MDDESQRSELAEGTGQVAFALVDVESEIEFLSCGPGASPDSSEFLERVARRTRGDKHMRVIVYCAGRHRHASTRASRILTQAGYTEILEYRAGQEIWHSSPRGFRGRPGNPIASGARRGTPFADEAPRGEAGE
jgi:rhodanese-related sulfurtransferase